MNNSSAGPWCCRTGTSGTKAQAAIMEQGWSTCQCCTAATLQISVMRYKKQDSQQEETANGKRAIFTTGAEQMCSELTSQLGSSPSLKKYAHLSTKRYKTAVKTQIIWFIKWVINKKSSWKITHWELNIKWAFRWENKSVCWKLAIQQWGKRSNRWRRYENWGFHRWLSRWYLMHWKKMERDVPQEQEIMSQHYFIKLHCNQSKHWALTFLEWWNTY